MKVEAIHSAALKKYHKAGINKNKHTTNGVQAAASAASGVLPAMTRAAAADGKNDENQALL